MGNELLNDLEKLHTTEGGAIRIVRNLKIDTSDPVAFCKALIISPAAKIKRRGKNWYILNGDTIITVNAYSYTIITAHKSKGQWAWDAIDEE